MAILPLHGPQPPNAGANGHLPSGAEAVQFIYFSEIVKRRICTGSISNRIGRVNDLVFHSVDAFPEAVGIYVVHGWGRPSEFIPWDRVVKIEDDAIFVEPAPEGRYPPFADQPGWILIETHLMGRTILDIDGRRIEVVNDVRLRYSLGRLLLTDVDLSFQGFLRRWGLSALRRGRNRLISWKYVQPLSLEDAVPTDRLKLSITRNQLQDLPSEDLADALEELTGTEQQALFSALDPDKAADSLAEAEPRAQRQIIERLTPEQERAIFGEMSVLQLANLFTSLPKEKLNAVAKWLGPDRAQAVRNLLTEHEATAKDMISSEFVVKPVGAKVGDVFHQIRDAGYEPRSLSYVYIVADDAPVLQGMVDLRDLVLAHDEATMGDIMVSPVVTAQAADQREDLEKLFEKYGFGMIPVVDDEHHILGVIRHSDIMNAPELNT